MMLLFKEELVKRIYRKSEYKPKMIKLVEYYKFHKEIPRVFAKEVYDTFFDHHDRKRKVEFIAITRRLKEENGEDVKGELEKELKKFRDVQYEPMLKDLPPLISKSY